MSVTSNPEALHDGYDPCDMTRKLVSLGSAMCDAVELRCSPIGDINVFKLHKDMLSNLSQYHQLISRGSSNGSYCVSDIVAVTRRFVCLMIKRDTLYEMLTCDNPIISILTSADYNNWMKRRDDWERDHDGADYQEDHPYDKSIGKMYRDLVNMKINYIKEEFVYHRLSLLTEDKEPWLHQNAVGWLFFWPYSKT